MRRKVLVGYSTCFRTRDSFRLAGHDAYTCDLLPARGSQEFHFERDIWQVLNGYRWDFAILHPMCTYLTVSSAWAFNDPDYDRYPGVGYHQRVKAGTLTGMARRVARYFEIENFRRLLALPFPAVIENPASSFVSKVLRGPTQIIHPHQFGDDASKATGLWFNDAALAMGLPRLVHTGHVAPRMVDGKPRWSNQTDSGQNCLTPSDDRWLLRSETYPGIAAAIGDQWGRWLSNQE